MHPLNLDFINTVSKDSTKEYNELVNEIFEVFKENLTKSTREAYMDASLDGVNFSIKLNDFFLSLILLSSRLPFRDETVEKLEFKITKEDFIHDVKDVNGAIYDYMNDTFSKYRKVLPIRTVKRRVGYALELLARYMWYLNYYKGNTVNIYDILQFMKEQPEVYDILHYNVEENQQFSEIERSISERTNRLVQLIKAYSDENYLNAMIDSVSLGQFQQTFVNVGLKPDLYENIIPKPINTSILRGFRDSNDYLINAIGARKALVVNATSVRDAGYLSRKLGLLLISSDLDSSVEDCGHRPLLNLTIPNEDIAKRYVERYYKDKPSSKKFKLITEDNYKSLVGKAIYVASPITCNLSSKDKICKTCYGNLADLSNFHVGTSKMLVLTQQITQMLLSSKHLLKVVVDNVGLPSGMESLFEIDKNLVVATEPLTVKIKEATMSDYNDDIVLKHFTIINSSGEEISVSSNEDLEFILYGRNITLDFSDEDDLPTFNVVSGETTFKLELQNNGLGSALRKLLSLIESGSEMNKRSTVEELTLDIIQLLCDSKIRLSAVGAELIVRELARSIDDKKVKSYSPGDLEFLRLPSAIMESPSVGVALSFQEYGRLLKGKLFTKGKYSSLDIVY